MAGSIVYYTFHSRLLAEKEQKRYSYAWSYTLSKLLQLLRIYQ